MKRKTTNQSLMHELLQLADDFAEHTYVSAFTLNALTAVMSNENAMQQDVIEGAKLSAQMLQLRTKELKQSIDHAFQRYRDEQDRIGSTGR